MAAKDFASIENDYAFFMAHATEAAADLAEYARELADFATGRTVIRLLDVGCGTGEFSEQLLSTMNWSPEALRLTLVEPVPHQRDQAAVRLARFSKHSIATAEKLTSMRVAGFDLILSNHALYYVDDLDATLRDMLEALAPRGVLLLAVAGWDNMLIELWKLGFTLLGKPVPYYVAEDVEGVLNRRGATFRTSKSHFQLRFPDSTENRMKILRFLFAEHLAALPTERMLGEFDPYVSGQEIEVPMHSYHFAVDPLPLPQG